MVPRCDGCKVQLAKLSPGETTSLGEMPLKILARLERGEAAEMVTQSYRHFRSNLQLARELMGCVWRLADRQAFERQTRFNDR